MKYSILIICCCFLEFIDVQSVRASSLDGNHQTQIVDIFYVDIPNQQLILQGHPKELPLLEYTVYRHRLVQHRSAILLLFPSLYGRNRITALA